MRLIPSRRNNPCFLLLGSGGCHLAQLTIHSSSNRNRYSISELSHQAPTLRRGVGAASSSSIRVINPSNPSASSFQTPMDHASSSLPTSSKSSPLGGLTGAAPEFVDLKNDNREVSGAASPWDQLIPPSSTASSPPSAAGATKYNVKLRLTPKEERIFRLLVEAAEAYEVGSLTPDPIGDDTEEIGCHTPPKKDQMTKLIKNVDNGRIGNNDDDGVFVAAGKQNIVGIRVAGGWVRDKLLHQHSDDVDVALDCMMGVQFARVVQSYMALSPSTPSSDGGEDGDNDYEGVKEERRLKRRPAGRGRRHPKIGVIGANPLQSKHLETATMKIYGIDVDFVNLRANEVYGADSRIPTFGTTLGSWSLEPGLGEAGSGSRIPPSFGAPLEDALRRDFTINSLFYNVRTGKIEDWTGRGLDDLLRRRLVVTPVDPHVTFHDDPLRVLRAIRFAVRLDFALDASIVEAAMSERVHRSLHAKVSRERIGKELEGMLSGKHARPGRALDAIARLHLAGSVFTFPGKFPGDQDQVGGPVTGRILGVEYTCDLCTSVSAEASVNFDVNSLIAESAARQRARGWEESRMLLLLLPKLMKGQINEMEKMAINAANVLPLTPVDQRLLYLCVFILPFYELTFPDRKGREVTVTSHMVKEAIKFPQRDAQSVSKILSQIDEMATLLSEFRSQMTNAISMQEKRGDSTQKLTPPCRMRVGLLLRSLKEQWVTCLIAAAAWEIRTYPIQHVGDNEEGIATSLVPADQPVRELYRAIVDNLGLDRCWHMHPHLNGKEIIKDLGLHNGPLVGAYVEDQTRWMLLNPHGTKEECVTHLRERKMVRGG